MHSRYSCVPALNGQHVRHHFARVLCRLRQPLPHPRQRFRFIVLLLSHQIRQEGRGEVGGGVWGGMFPPQAKLPKPLLWTNPAQQRPNHKHEPLRSPLVGRRATLFRVYPCGRVPLPQRIRGQQRRMAQRPHPRHLGCNSGGRESVVRDLARTALPLWTTHRPSRIGGIQK